MLRRGGGRGNRNVSAGVPFLAFEECLLMGRVLLIFFVYRFGFFFAGCGDRGVFCLGVNGLIGVYFVVLLLGS